MEIPTPLSQTASVESGILMLYGNARRHRRISEAGIEEMETRKHSSSLLRIQAYVTRVRAAPVSLCVIILHRLVSVSQTQIKPKILFRLL